ncbi:hypothetical protein ICMP_333 [Candidatus Ishikawaella capsulata Mpkobe]|uniref:Uncharacterized protein n=1 Tax=Candidatus Ishikawaella capsulata Mpkobe TaxID=476281 RepID=C5WCY1_9ENTR|nr:hypothetical protein ICMP_333 [Candidatus Ishikawaella capsulata Mpkobe]
MMSISRYFVNFSFFLFCAASSASLSSLRSFHSQQ